MRKMTDAIGGIYKNAERMLLLHFHLTIIEDPVGVYCVLRHAIYLLASMHTLCDSRVGV